MRFHDLVNDAAATTTKQTIPNPMPATIFSQRIRASRTTSAVANAIRTEQTLKIDGFPLDTERQIAYNRIR